MIRLFMGPLVLVCVFYGLLVTAIAQDEPPKPGQPRPNKEREADSEEPLPKYDEMVLPSAEELLRSKPFDWIVLKNLKVLVVEPVSPRPDALAKMHSEYDRYLKARAGFPEG